MNPDTIATATSEFVAALFEDPAIISFRAAEQNMDQDSDFAQIRDRYNETARVFQQKQADGSLEQEDIAALRELQNRINSHPAALRFIEARDDVASLIQQCNQEISSVLGFDFAAAAGPRGGCSC